MMSFQQINSSQLVSLSKILKEQKSSLKDFERFGLNLSDTQILNALSKDICFGLFESNNLVAFILGRKVDQTVYEIDMTMTDKNHLKKGFMEMLFWESIEFLKSKGTFSEIWLEVHEENEAAIAFYQKMGFIVNTKRPKYYPDGKGAILMTLSV